MAYYESDFATVEYDSETDAVIAMMSDFASGEEFRDYMNNILEAVRENNTNKIITDTSDMGALKEEDQVWSVKEWEPRAEEAGVEHMAFVMPESVIAEMSVEKVLEMSNDNINRDFFEDGGEARHWIQNK